MNRANIPPISQETRISITDAGIEAIGAVRICVTPAGREALLRDLTKGDLGQATRGREKVKRIE